MYLNYHNRKTGGKEKEANIFMIYLNVINNKLIRNGVIMKTITVICYFMIQTMLC